MADSYDFPDDLVGLRVELLDADEAWAAAPDPQEAYRRVHDLTMQLYDHAWLREAGATHSVRMALREAAKARRAAQGT
jgi:hypothetical protein